MTATFQANQIVAVKDRSMKKTVLLALYAFSNVAMAQTTATKSFEDIWSSLYQKSYQQKSAQQDKISNELTLERANRHWLPRAYVAGQWFSTNDPTQVFFSNLGQRSIQQADFIPSDLNRPGRKNFTTGTLGIDLPLYEGGMKSAQASMFDSLVKASELEVKAKRTEEYSELSRQYGGALVHAQNGALLSDLKNSLQKIISGYQVGSQSNPVGYSGLLGLKGVDNRIEGMSYEFEMKRVNAQKWIDTKTQSTENWSPDLNLHLKDFLNTNLTQTSSISYSTMMLAQELKVKTLDDAKQMEKARFLPKVGLFAQNNLYDGDRSTTTSQAYGVYLMWDLFNSDSYGRVGEANAKSMAAEAKLNASKQEEKIMLSQLLESKTTLEKNLVLLEKTDGLLKEQTVNAMKLFRSGMLSALQLAEVINRRVDLIENKNKAETQYLDVYSRLYQLNN
jgi:outer membrane protein TolC